MSDIHAKVSTSAIHLHPNKHLPALVLVSGAPATGKTTLARLISEALGLPLISRDDIWEVVVDSLKIQSRDEGRIYLQPMFDLYYSLLIRLLDAGVSLVTESNFNPERAERELKAVLSRTRGVLVHCETPRQTSISRFIDRFEAGDRSRSAFDSNRIAEIARGEGMEPWDYGRNPVVLDIPTLRVDTTSGYSPGLEEILAFVSDGLKQGT